VRARARTATAVTPHARPLARPPRPIPRRDIKNVPGVPDQLMAACDGLPACAAFNTDGWLKSSVAVT